MEEKWFLIQFQQKGINPMNVEINKTQIEGNM